MDALEKMLAERYGLSANEAKASAGRIHSEHSNEDNLQTEAYTPIARNEVDWMDRLRKKFTLFTDIAKRKAAGEKVSPEHNEFYEGVTATHRENVAARLQARTAQDREKQRQAGGSGGAYPYAGNPVYNTVRKMAGTQGIVDSQVAPVLGPGHGPQYNSQPSPEELQRRDGYLQKAAPGPSRITPEQEEAQMRDLYQNQYPIQMPAKSARRK